MLLSLEDVLPTVAELAGLSSQQNSAADPQFMGNFTALSPQWSGKSFGDLLAAGGKATQEQQERYHFTLVTCPATDYIMKKLPALGPDRQVKIELDQRACYLSALMVCQQSAADHYAYLCMQPVALLAQPH
jgi:arylsulfatase A-like enzyme